MGLGKKLLISLAGLIVAGIVGFAPMLIGTAAATFFASGTDGNSGCVAQSVDTGSDTGITADAYFALHPELEAQQKQNAGIIIQEGVKLGATNRDIKIAVETAVQESNLINLTYGDAHSHGLFQQQYGGEYGSIEDTETPTIAADMFYRQLFTVANREDPSVSRMEVAIEVQIPRVSAYTSRWNWDVLGDQLVGSISGVGENPSPSATGQPIVNQCQAQSGDWVLPMTYHYTMGDPFGERVDPVYGGGEFHEGQDLVAPSGTPIYAVHSGTLSIVDAAGNSSELGNHVEINHGGNVKTGYGHMSEIAPGLQVGQEVSAGQLIGYVGSTGKSTGPHLHFYVMVNDKYVDPVSYMLTVGVDLANHKTQVTDDTGATPAPTPSLGLSGLGQ